MAAAVVVVGGVLLVTRDDDGDRSRSPPSSRPTTPSPSSAGSAGDLRLVHSDGEDAAVLLADECRVPDGDDVYELWAIGDGSPPAWTRSARTTTGRLPS